MEKENHFVTNVPKKDKCLIYYSYSDDFWIAHGLFVDQIGTGQSVLCALVDFLIGVQNLRELANARKDIHFWRDAPKKLQVRAKIAKRLPLELYSVAHRKARGEWPEDIKLLTEASREHALVIQ